MKSHSPSSPRGFLPPSPLAFTPTNIQVEQVAEMFNYQCEGGSSLLPVTPQVADVGKSDQGADFGKSDRKDFQDFPISPCVKEGVLSPVQQEIMGLKIIKQRKEVLETDLIEARRKNEERTQELEEKVRRRKAEKVLKEFQSQMTGKPVDKLEAQKRERIKEAEKRKEAFKKKQEEKTRCEDLNNVRKRKDLDQNQDKWVVERGVTIQMPSGKRGKTDHKKIESVHVLKEKEVVVTGKGDERKATQERSKGEAEMAKKTGATGDKKSMKKRFIECSACGMKVSIQGVI